MRDKRTKRTEENKNPDYQEAEESMKWIPAKICEKCGEAEHIYFCPKPDNIEQEVWQNMSDEERLAVERSSE